MKYVIGDALLSNFAWSNDQLSFILNKYFKKLCRSKRRHLCVTIGGFNQL